MKREFNIGDIAHLAKGKRFKGILNYNTEKETIKVFTSKFQDSVKIIGYNEADEKHCGGWTYDCEVEFKGVVYRIDYLSQFDLIPKKMWEQNLELGRKIKELESKLK